MLASLRLPRLAALVLSLAVLAGCDSNNSGSSLRDLDGNYALEELLFDPNAGALQNADVAARLDLAGSQLTIYGRDGEAQLVVRFTDGSGTQRTDLIASASRGRLTLTAASNVDAQELAELLLPNSFQLSYNASSISTLESNFTVSGVNLDAFDREQYAGLTSVDGVMRVRFTRL